MRFLPVLLVSLLALGCGAESMDAPPVTPTGGGPGASAASAERRHAAHPDDDDDDDDGPAAGMTTMQHGDPSRVVILQTTKLDRFAEVIGPVDVHEAMGDEAAALQKLREKASAIGADAVVGVEFHHSEGEGEPTHLSGLAVRFIARPSLPMH